MGGVMPGSSRTTVGSRSNIAQIREQRGLTQRQLAEVVGVTEATIANWERGRSGAEWFIRLSKLCQALECQPGDLLDGSGEGSR
jgi:transcriptional regulator with XRE-family HTH domain